MFVGVGVQPAIAKVEPKALNNDDCNLCSIIRNLKVYRTIREKDFLKLNDDLKNESFIRDDGVICAILLIILLRYALPIIILDNIMCVISSYPLLSIFYFPVYQFFTEKNFYILSFYENFLFPFAENINCQWLSTP